MWKGEGEGRGKRESGAGSEPAPLLKRSVFLVQTNIHNREKSPKNVLFHDYYRHNR